MGGVQRDLSVYCIPLSLTDGGQSLMIGNLVSRYYEMGSSYFWLKCILNIVILLRICTLKQLFSNFRASARNAIGFHVT